jgi:hypothetical protein
MRETIIYHNDTDGVFSAAVYMFYNKGKEFNLLPVASDERSDLDNIINGIDSEVIILDYQYNDKAKFWCDHHFNEKFGNGVIKTDRMNYDPSSKSNASLLCSYFAKEATLEDVAYAVYLVDMVDAAEYSSADYVFMSMEPIMKIKRYIDEYAKPNTKESLNRVVNLIVENEFDLKLVCESLNFNHRGCQIRMLRAATTYGVKATIEDGVAFYDIESNLVEPPRYSEYFVYDNIKAGVRVRYSDNNTCYVSIGVNPWGKKYGHVGEFIRNLQYVKGGGHAGVGGLTIHEDDLKTLREDVLHFFKDR